jgi:PhzF family phenazine biosynthesis protein
VDRTYKVVDVFTGRPLLGNPVAVVLDAEGLDGDAMQRIARWTNLSETTFVLPPDGPEAAYRLRIFTPGRELPFAGHPTLGSAHALIEAGRVTPHGGRIVQECGAGLVGISSSASGLELTLPEPRLTALAPTQIVELEAILGATVDRSAEPALVNVGPAWIVAQLGDADAVLALRPDFARCAAFEQRLQATGVSVFGARATGAAAIEVRSFAPSCGVNEDPVCGSGNGAIAAFRRARGLLSAAGAAYLAAQGQCVWRDGRVAITVAADGAITVGGSCVTVIDGVLRV